MNTRLLLPLGFSLLFVAGLLVRTVASSAPAAPPPPPAESGTFPAQWVNGTACATEPRIQVHAYNDNLYILRQSKCAHFEAPFIYLIFGRDRALMIDTGSTVSIPLVQTVDRIVQAWLLRNGIASIELVVAHSHAHGDHIQGDAQMATLPYATVVGLSQAAVQAFFGLSNWPNGLATYDLGGRVLDVIPTPGHQVASLTFYDRRTQLLLTGDIVYPGHLFIFSPATWPDFRASIQRLIDFAAVNPVSWVLGCHIEMSATPGGCLTWGLPSHPSEHVLQLPANVLREVRNSADAMGSNPVCGDVRDDFVIHPVWLCPITAGC